MIFKEAKTNAELEQVQSLNHSVFAEEVGQHATRASGLLADSLQQQSRYFLAMQGTTVIGMISANPGPSFSVSKRLPQVDLLSAFSRPLEVRLLAIRPEYRGRTVLAGLVWQVYELAQREGFSHLLISALESREVMYRKMGFRPLGPAVPEGAAAFIPMVMDVDEADVERKRYVDSFRRHCSSKIGAREMVSLMPGPVCISPQVREAFSAVPESHRSARFVAQFQRVRTLLNQFVEGAEVALLPGGGTLANDAVAANLKAIFGDGEGLVVSNGEFGERLTGHALASGLRFRHLKFPWGEVWEGDALAEALERRPAWVWGVQLETSTGVFNDTERLCELARRNGTVVALDCVSSIGARRIVAEGTRPFVVTGVSGKSLGSYAGVAFVFVSAECRDRLQGKLLPASFDILGACRTEGPLSTISSPLIGALATALESRYGSNEAVQQTFAAYEALGRETRRMMREAGIPPLACESIAAPNVATFLLPNLEFPLKCELEGYRIAHESSYLRERGWGQIATMGDISERTVRSLFDGLRHGF